MIYRYKRTRQQGLPSALPVVARWPSTLALFCRSTCRTTAGFTDHSHLIHDQPETDCWYYFLALMSRRYSGVDINTGNHIKIHARSHTTWSRTLSRRDEQTIVITQETVRSAVTSYQWKASWNSAAVGWWLLLLHYTEDDDESADADDQLKRVWRRVSSLPWTISAAAAAAATATATTGRRRALNANVTFRRQAADCMFQRAINTSSSRPAIDDDCRTIDSTAALVNREWTSS